MNEILKLTQAITERQGVILILTKAKEQRRKTDLIYHLIVKGHLLVIAADEWLPGFALPQIIRRHGSRVKEVAKRLRTVCPTTHLRLMDSLSTISPKGEPMLVLDFLHPFYDSKVNFRLRFQVLRQCCNHLKRIATQRPILIMTQEMSGQDYEQFIPLLHSIAQKILYLEPESEAVLQDVLF